MLSYEYVHDHSEKTHTHTQMGKQFQCRSNDIVDIFSGIVHQRNYEAVQTVFVEGKNIITECNTARLVIQR